MGLWKKWRDRRAEAAFVARVRSTDWFTAEDAIGRLPGPLSPEKAFELAALLSTGHSNTAVTVVGLQLARGETPSVTIESNTGTHFRSAIGALGRIANPAARARLLQIITEMPGFAEAAVRALGSPRNAASAAELFALARGWTGEIRRTAWASLWQMETEEAFEFCFQLDLLQGPKTLEGLRLQQAGSNQAYRELLHGSWHAAIEERRHPRPVGGNATKPLPLP
jgi:hypothetical protein